jgi:hypothetical protein
MALVDLIHAEQSFAADARRDASGMSSPAHGHDDMDDLLDDLLHHHQS